MATHNASPRKNLLDYATSLAIETARKNGHQHPAKLVVRKKSQAYLYGRIQKEFAEASEEAIRETIAALRWVEWPEVEVWTVPSRKPIKGREPVTDECWGPRIARLAGLLSEEMTGPELVAQAVKEFRWTAGFATQVLAASEELGALEYAIPNWRRSQAETAVELPDEPVVVEATAGPERSAEQPRQLCLWPALDATPRRQRRAARSANSRRRQRSAPSGQLELHWGAPRAPGRRRVPARKRGDPSQPGPAGASDCNANNRADGLFLGSATNL